MEDLNQTTGDFNETKELVRIKKWTKKQLQEWVWELCNNFLTPEDFYTADKIVNIFKEHYMDGKALYTLTDLDLSGAMGISDPRVRAHILGSIEREMEEEEMKVELLKQKKKKKVQKIVTKQVIKEVVVIKEVEVEVIKEVEVEVVKEVEVEVIKEVEVEVIKEVEVEVIKEVEVEVVKEVAVEVVKEVEVFVPQIETVYETKEIFVERADPETTKEQDLKAYSNGYVNENKCSSVCGLNQQSITHLVKNMPKNLQGLIKTPQIGIRKLLGVKRDCKFGIGILPILHEGIDTSEEEELLNRCWENFNTAWEEMKNFVVTPEQREIAKEKLFKWREAKANEDGKKKDPEKILSVLTIQDLLKKFPQDVMQFHMCYKCKTTKINNYCKEILAIFNPQRTFTQTEIMEYVGAPEFWLFNHMVSMPCEVKIEHAKNQSLATKIKKWRNVLAKEELDIKNWKIFTNRVLVNIADSVHAKRSEEFTLACLEEQLDAKTFQEFGGQWPKLIKVLEDFRQEHYVTN